MKENCCLCKCFTELYFFHWLLVVPLQFYRYVVRFQSFMNIARRSTQNTARIKLFLRLHIHIKPLNRKSKITNSLLCWRVTLFMVTASLAFVKIEYWLAVKVILEMFSTVSLKAHNWSSWILSAICLEKLWNTAFCPRSSW